MVIMATEGYFPRGGVQKSNKRITFDDEGEPDLLKDSQTAGERPAKRLKLDKGKEKGSQKSKDHKLKPKDVSKSKKKAGGGKVKVVPAEKTIHSIFVPERLSTKKVAKSTLMIGAVKDIRDYELRLNLPNNLIGVVSITDMPDAYTTQLKKFAQSTDDDTAAEDLHSLDEIFSIGQYVPCVCIGEPSEDMKQIKVSVNPKLVNEQVSVKALTYNQVLYGAIAGIEDHGCLIDLGMKEVRAFMKLETASSDGLMVGEIRRFRVIDSDMITLIAGETRTISVCLHDSDSKEIALSGKSVVFRNLLPGQLVDAKIDKRSKEGVTFNLGSLKGYAHVTHLPKHSKEFEALQTMKVRILAVNQNTKYIYVTCLPSLVNSLDDPPSEAPEYTVGDPVQPTVSRVVDKYAFLDMSEGSQTYIGTSMLPEEHEVSVKLNQTKLKCYWLAWDYLEQKAIISTKKPNVKKSLLPTLKAGETVETKILRVGEKGAKVRMVNGLHAFIQNLYLTEVPLKNPEKKLKEGNGLTCQILAIDQERKRVRLTSKPSMLKSTLQIIDSYENVKTGAMVLGVIVKLTTGALVSFYNNITGFVPNSQLAKDRVTHPSMLFYVGQAVKCRVLSCEPEERKLTLTFLLDGSGGLERPRDRQRLAENVKSTYNGPILCGGEILPTVSVQEKTDKGLKLISGQGHRGFIPKSELADSALVSSVYMQCVDKGDTLNNVMCITPGKSTIFTQKSLMKDFAVTDQLAKSWESVEVDKVYPATVMSLTKNGVFVNFGNGMIGLAPRSMLPLKHGGLGENPALYLGQSVLAQVTMCDANLKRIIVSLREVDCPVDNQIQYNLLAQYIKDMSICKQLASQKKALPEAVYDYNVGDIVTGRVISRDETSITVQLNNGIRAIASGDLMSGCTAQEGTSIEAMVVFIDMLEDTLQIIADPHIVTTRRDHSKEDQFSMVKQGQVIKSEVVLVRDDYTLVMLKAHALGKLAYIPTQRHPNGVCGRMGLLYRQINRVTIIKRICDGVVIAGFETDKEKNSKKAKKLQNKFNLPTVGSKVIAKIATIGDMQLNLLIGDAIGQLMIHEITDTPKPGASLLDMYMPGQEIEVTIKSVIPIKINHKFASLHDSKQKAMLECTLRAIKSWEQKDCNSSQSSVKKNQEMLVFVDKVDLASKQKRLHVITNNGVRGLLAVFDLGQDFSSMDNLMKEYPAGSCMIAVVKNISADGTIYFRGISNRATVPSSDQHTTQALILSFTPSVGLSVSVPFSPNIMIPFSELSEPGEDVDMERFQPRLFITVNIVKKTRHKSILSLRKNSGLLTPSLVQVGDVHPGVISLVGPKACTVMVGGLTSNLNVKKYKGFIKSHHVGSGLWVKIERVQGDVLNCSVCPVNHIPDSYVIQRLPILPRKRRASSMENEQDNCDLKKGSPWEEPQKIASTTGVQIRISSRKELKKPVLDFGANVKSLNATGEVISRDNSKLEALEKQGKNLTQHERTLSNNEANRLARSVENDMSPDVTTQKSEGLPKSESDYLVILNKSPNDVVTWKKLLSFALETYGIEAGRSRAEQALKAISYREEAKKLTLWSAYLEMELSQGTADSFEALQRRAFQHSDDVKLYHELIRIHTNAGQSEETERCYMNLVRKHSEDMSQWTSFSQFYHEQGRHESARSLLQRCLKAIPKNKHVDTIAKFAQLEFKLGSQDRGESMFESIVSNYPKRTDIWSVYIDMLVKVEHYDRARSILKRVVTQQMNHKKLNSFYKKFIDFETRHGTDETVAEVKQMASLSAD